MKYDKNLAFMFKKLSIFTLLTGTFLFQFVQIEVFIYIFISQIKK